LTSMQEEAFDRHDIVDFLRHVLRHIEGKVLIIWDGLPAHRSQKVKDFLSEYVPTTVGDRGGPSVLGATAGLCPGLESR
jgi:hypothetical protein